MILKALQIYVCQTFKTVNHFAYWQKSKFGIKYVLISYIRLESSAVEFYFKLYSITDCKTALLQTFIVCVRRVGCTHPL